ncbi:hypothetical protein M3G15_08640 [Paenibacillus sp. p3-SID1389]|uniref:hypothetical protein n=1 Tax=Paenibacillus sp. p3-SID1389 TaxID=2916364 RepID=UPI0021A5BA9C|nr:hypothetical protein [Paenibacillus sp. p3-SID1389]MCT2195207.1 hypothetical protein [Paenibacillus sp. p3-SID1389]
MKIDWKRKLSSRKFWALLAALATSILTAAGAGESVTLQVTGVIGAVGACVAYMLSESYADANGSGDKTEE